MSNFRTKFSKELKAKVVLEALKESEPIESLAEKYELQPGRFQYGKFEL